MSTLKYKATGRYSTDWSDYRGVFGMDEPSKYRYRATGLEDVPTQVLRDLWMVRFGERAVLTTAFPLKGTDDIANVGQELSNRNLIRHEKVTRQDLLETTYYYILEKADGDN
jgi:hypothetical protein